jgi:CBS domain-containing protein
VERATAVRNPLIRAPQATDLSAPVGTVMRPTLTVEAIDSLARAAGVFRENGTSVLPVVDGEGRLQGVLTNGGLARALAESSEPTDAVGPFAERAETLQPYATAAEALRRGEDGQTRVVVDDAGRVVGIISAVDLWPRRRIPLRPSVVGGMATPFGVYLTTGNVSAGVSWWALMATGASMLLMLTAGTTAASLAAKAGVPGWGQGVLLYGTFLLLLRLVPMSGTHGAEHQVVHAIEREETLVPDVVRRMPRVHPRCGTNLAAGLSLFLGILMTPWYPDMTVRALPALLAAALFAIPLGSFLQKYVTTKPPSDRQLAGAIRSAEAVLEKYATASYSRPTPLRRLWNMGILQVMAGAFLMAALLAGLKQITGIPWLPDLL